jgi:hypothetical protein
MFSVVLPLGTTVVLATGFWLGHVVNDKGERGRLVRKIELDLVVGAGGQVYEAATTLVVA